MDLRQIVSLDFYRVLTCSGFRFGSGCFAQEHSLVILCAPLPVSGFYGTARAESNVLADPFGRGQAFATQTDRKTLKND